MSNLYPSLEDFKYDILINSKHPSSHIGAHLRNVGGYTVSGNNSSHANGHLPSKYMNNDTSLSQPLGNFMGSHLDDLHPIGAHSSSITLLGKQTFVAPLSGYIHASKLQPSNAIRQVIICKDSNGKVGLRLCSVQSGVFVVLVYVSSPAAIAGLRFGDQILEINDVPVAGYSMKKVHALIKNSSPDELRFTVRDRPLERTVTLHKDQDGIVGLVFNKHGKIIKIVKDSSAARNGLLINHNILEINWQNVVGLDDKDLRNILDSCGEVVVLTIMPSDIFEVMIKYTDARLLRRNMDHTAPDS